MCGMTSYEIQNTEHNCLLVKENEANYMSNFQKFNDIPNSSDIMDILNFIKFETYYCQITPSLQDKFKQKIKNYSYFARNIKTSSNTIYRIVNQTNYWINFQTLMELAKILQIQKSEIFNSIKYVKTKNSFPIKFNIKNLTSPALYRIIGHVLGDGGINVIKDEGKYRLFYVNNEHVLINSFKNDITFLFGETKTYFRERELHGDEVWYGTTLGYIFFQILNYENSNGKRIPNFVFESKNTQLISSLIQAFYDDEGTIYPTKNMIAISQKSEDLIKDIRNLIISMGINVNSIKLAKPKNRSQMYYFYITGKDNILKFSDKIGFLHPEKAKKLQILIKKYEGK